MADQRSGFKFRTNLGLSLPRFEQPSSGFQRLTSLSFLCTDNSNTRFMGERWCHRWSKTDRSRFTSYLRMQWNVFTYMTTLTQLKCFYPWTSKVILKIFLTGSDIMILDCTVESSGTTLGLEKVSPLGRCPLIEELTLKMHWLYFARAMKVLSEYLLQERLQ